MSYVDPGLVGPYSADNGFDMAGHPVNGFGRCEQLNTTGVCPTSAQATVFYMNQTLISNIELAAALGIAIPQNPTNDILVPLMIAVMYP